MGTLVCVGGSRVGADGRAHVHLHGGRRFRVDPASIAVQPASFGLSVGRATFFDDEPPEGAPPPPRRPP